DANDRLRIALQEAASVNAGEIASACTNKSEIPHAVRRARLVAVAQIF
ncbi:MAG: hypothetical protein RIR18_2335, partial [Pseudomonadota bacterium]